MMENPRLEEEQIIKGTKNLFRLKKEQNDMEIKDIRNLFRIKKEIKGIKNIVLRSIKNLFEYKEEEKNYCKPVRVDNFYNNNYIEYKSNSDKSKILLVEDS